SSADEALVAVGAGADTVLLDNLACQVIPRTGGGLIMVGPRWGVVLGTLPQFMGPYTDAVSMEYLPLSAPTLDFALQV
ncbi:NADC pyrophosphorylase, partial [Anthoscopus minutus]|nr:NADC pyrophosphorylase [Anthoscopus minutus]